MLRKTLFIAMIGMLVVSIQAQTTEFTYQGNLKDGANQANGNYDFEFLLFDALVAGNQVGVAQTKSNVAVADGIFSVKLDFGNQFPGANRFLEIRVRPAGAGGITILAPRQSIGSSPYGVRSLTAVNADLAANATNAVNATNAANAINATNAVTATNATQLGGVAANQYVLTGDARLNDARTPSAGSTNYIQNGTTQQSSSNFNVSGTGTANIFNSATQFNINGRRVLSVPSLDNTFVGENTGTNSTGFNNSFFGSGAGLGNTSGNANSFFGTRAGNVNSTGSQNSFFGQSAGGSNSTGSFNSSFGSNAGAPNSTGSSNTFIGRAAGGFSGSGDNNTFVGALAGNANISGTQNTVIGAEADVAANNLENATAIGFRAAVSQSNSLVLGSISGVNGANADTNVGIGTTAPTNLLTIGSPEATVVSGKVGIFSTTGTNLIMRETTNDVEGIMGVNSSSGVIFGSMTNHSVNLRTNNSNRIVIDTAGNVGVGTNGPTEKLDIAANSGNILFGGAGCPSGSVAIGLNGAFGSCANFSIRGSGTDLLLNRPAGGSILFRESNGVSQVRINPSGTLSVLLLGAAGSTSLCRNSSDEISTCSSSARYKNNINSFTSGLSLIKQLRPVSFNWKDGGMLDMGLVAEEVNAVEPLLTTTNASGQVEGVKYDRVGVVLINAVKEQQTQIDAQAKEIEGQKAIIAKQQAEIDMLKAYVCSQSPAAAVCKLQN